VLLIIYGLFNDAASGSDYRPTASSGKAVNVVNWKVCGRNRTWPDLRYYPGICQGLRKTTGETSVDIADIQSEILTQDLPNMKKECCPLDINVPFHVMSLDAFLMSLVSKTSDVVMIYIYMMNLCCLNALVSVPEACGDDGSCLNALVSVPEVYSDDGSCQTAVIQYMHNSTGLSLRTVFLDYCLRFRPVSRTPNADRDVARCYRHCVIYKHKYHIFQN
jgi:hypothetical protein